MVHIGIRSRSVKRTAVLRLQNTHPKYRRASRDPNVDHTMSGLRIEVIYYEKINWQICPKV